ncbi:hypothetical protein [Grimontia hollisae]|uniref:Uncharacterized protein n=1 Tax=Grimontia hollisae TaxID=673 RepID=A0A377J7Q2_GRIHO|nr:hypothetical protein [Grimontia hollisae]STO98329.1 Uncharacterised protein [Grimontia hollisae]
MKLVNVLSGDVVKESDNLDELKHLGMSIALQDGLQATQWSLDETCSHYRMTGKTVLCLRDEEGAVFRIFLPK